MRYFCVRKFFGDLCKLYVWDLYLCFFCVCCYDEGFCGDFWDVCVFIFVVVVMIFFIFYCFVVIFFFYYWYWGFLFFFFLVNFKKNVINYFYKIDVFKMYYFMFWWVLFFLDIFLIEILIKIRVICKFCFIKWDIEVF